MLVAVAGKGQAQGRKGYGMKGQRLDRAKGKMGVSKGATRKFAESGSATLGVRRAGSRTMTRSEVLFCDRGHFSRSYSTILLRTKTKVQRDPRSWGPPSIFGDLNSQSKSAKWGIGGSLAGLGFSLVQSWIRHSSIIILLHPPAMAWLRGSSVSRLLQIGSHRTRCLHQIKEWKLRSL